jgi:hypothetical protein
MPPLLKVSGGRTESRLAICGHCMLPAKEALLFVIPGRSRNEVKAESRSASHPKSAVADLGS